jgi:heme/copper-type cytochrome/quinol oxidase subunit 2
MMRNDTDKPTLIALALVAALSMYAGLVRGPGDEDVLAQAVRSLTAGRPKIVQLAAVSVVHADEGLHPKVINISVSKLQITPDHIMLRKGQPAKLIFSSKDRASRVLLKALKIDANVIPARTTAVTVTPQVAGTFEAICGRCGPAGHSNIKMTVVVE